MLNVTVNSPNSSSRCLVKLRAFRGGERMEKWRKAQQKVQAPVFILRLILQPSQPSLCRNMPHI